MRVLTPRYRVSGGLAAVLLDITDQLSLVFEFALTLRVTPEDLTAAGTTVTGHGECVAAEHATADGRITDAQPGWTRPSSTALATKATAWTQSTSELAQMREVAAHGSAAADAARGS